MPANFVDIKFHQPYRGQIVEICVVKPAIYQGLTRYGEHDWNFTMMKPKPLFFGG